MMKELIPTTEEYDAVIVGAGASGAIVALELARKGKRVLVLEAGRSTRDDEDGWRSVVDTFHGALAKVPNSPYPPTAMAPQPDVMQLAPIKKGVPNSLGYFVQKGPQNFGSDYTRSKGGTTMHWLACALRMLPNDFRMRSMYGVGVDWPIGYDDLRKDYERAEREIGVSGDVGEYWLPGVDPKTYWEGYTYPMKKMPDSYVAKRLAARIGDLKVDVGGKDYKIRVTPTPQGRNGMPNPDYVDPVSGKKGDYSPTGTQSDPLRGERCQGNSSCTPICPVQAKYSAHRTLNRAQALKKGPVSLVTIECQSVATFIQTSKDNGRVQYIEYMAYAQDGAPARKKRAKGRVYIIAAHAVETAKLMLLSDIGNHSDQLGRNLMDHPTMLTWGLMDEPVWPFRGPGQTNAIPTFRDGPFRSEMAAFVLPIDNWGWIWSAFAPDVPFAQLVGQGMFGSALRQKVAHDFSRQVTLQFEIEQVGEAYNRVTIDRNFLDPLGVPRPIIHYELSDYVRRTMEAGVRISERIFKKAGITNKTQYSVSDPCHAEYNGKVYSYKGCGHYVGTHRMGSNRNNSVTDSHLRCWDHKNLYLVGCGAMPTFGTSNPSLTMAALAFRASRAIIKDLDKHTSKAL
jgi:choline dehydrogenase-like flavoprotein